ncbi:hypothetical protein BIV60_01255 [Bacillus sp. MUM 116]|uniref:acyl-CoA thioesterase n=1 Tax=Bacillus sp. MUM 116 TaxID=1678002 RepID=UPI0008F57CE2|nr:thioesterase family protein [Bacillus sp. MUM 116]OIK16933.1 hypothetical protein BIV60_01255 [Bacillus sp. MUM 116]
MAKAKYIDDFHKWEQGFSYFLPIRVRFSETDMFGHMNNTVPFVYFEEVRTEYLKSIGLMDEWVKPESVTFPVVADLQCDFLEQIFFGENLKVYVKAASVGNSSVDLHYMGKKEDGSVGFVGRGTLVQISKRTGKGLSWSEKMRSLLQKQIDVKV